MDNFSFDITTDGNLQGWLDCCMVQYHKAVGWSSHNDEKGQRLVFYWVAPPDRVDGYHPLPSPADSGQICAIAKAWLESVDRGRQPDHDGDNGRGFRLYNEAWGHVDEHYQAFLALSPAWAMYGK